MQNCIENKKLTLINTATGKAVDIPDCHTVNNTPMIAYGLNGGENQQWLFKKSKFGGYIIQSVFDNSKVLEKSTTSPGSVTITTFDATLLDPNHDKSDIPIGMHLQGTPSWCIEGIRAAPRLWDPL